MNHIQTGAARKMSLAQTRYEHIVQNTDGTALIADTNMKVVELILAHVAYGWSPQELHFQFPHITLGKIYSALAYYWDHKSLFDADITARLERIDEAAALQPKPGFVAGLQARHQT